jgi:Tetratricopeptide repeat
VAVQALNNLGVLHRERGNLERAAQCYTAALQIRPNFPQVGPSVHWPQPCSKHNGCKHGRARHVLREETMPRQCSM